MNDNYANSGYTSKLESLLELAQLLSRQNDYEEVLRLAVEKASSLVNSGATLIMMINPKTRNTVKTVFAQKNINDSQNNFIHANISGWVILNNRSLLSPDLKSDTRFRKNLFDKVQANSVICVPFKFENIIIGTLLLIKTESDFPFTELDLSLLEKFSAVVSPFLHCTQEIAQYFISPLPKQTLLNKYAELGLLGKSKKFIELLQSIEAAARCDVRILLEGQSGTGKELVAGAVHQLSKRSQNKFVAIDCGAILPNLIESELFGHVKGAFTGAINDRKGLFEEANGGTIFMDEINNLPFDTQAKLLRALQNEEIRPMGSNRIKKVDVRVITASSSSLFKLVNENNFREDLYYRLNVYPIFIPSLKERAEDILMLAEHFLKKFSLAQNKEIDGIHEEVSDFLMQRNWPGNIRELENVMERLVTLTNNKQNIIDNKILPPDLQKEMKKLKKDSADFSISKSLNESLIDFEEQLIRKTLINCNWNQSKAARLLNISEHSMRYKMTRLKIEKPI